MINTEKSGNIDSALEQMSTEDLAKELGKINPGKNPLDVFKLEKAKKIEAIIRSREGENKKTLKPKTEKSKKIETKKIDAETPILKPGAVVSTESNGKITLDKLRENVQESKTRLDEAEITGSDPIKKVELVENKQDPFVGELNRVRAKYANAYKEFYKDRETKIGRINKLRRFIGATIKNDVEIPNELKNLEKEYYDAVYEYGNKLYEKKKVDLLAEGKSMDYVNSSLKKYMSEELKVLLLQKEQEKREELQIENLPKKEKSALQKMGAWYGRQNKVTQKGLSIVAMSAVWSVGLLVATKVGVAAATSFGVYKIGRGIVGALAGQGAAEIVGAGMKGGIEKAKQNADQEIKGLFEKEGWDRNAFEQAKKLYVESIEENARKMARVNAIKLATKIAVGGATVWGLGMVDAFAEHSLSSTIDSESSNVISSKETSFNKSAIDLNSKPEVVVEVLDLKDIPPIDVNSKGAIATMADLKAQLETQYSNIDIAKAPENIQHILKTDAVSLAKEWGMFNPNDPSGEESAMMLKGSTITIDKSGNVTLHNLGKGDTILSGKGATIYKGEMFDSNHDAKMINPVDKAPTVENPEELPPDKAPEVESPEELPPDKAPEENPSTNTPTSSGSEINPEVTNLKPTDNNINWAQNNDILDSTQTSENGESIVNTESAIGHEVQIKGMGDYKVTINSTNNEVYVDGHKSQFWTEEFQRERRDILDGTRWFSWTGKGETFPEWKNLQNESMDKLGSEYHNFENAREERLFKHMSKLAKREGISTVGKTMTKVVEELALKKLG